MEVMLVIIIINILVMAAVMWVGTRHDEYQKIREPGQSKAVQRLTEKYQLRLKAANEKALPQTLVTAHEEVDKVLDEAFTEEEQPAKKPPVRASRRAAEPKSEES